MCAASYLVFLSPEPDRMRVCAAHTLKIISSAHISCSPKNHLEHNLDELLLVLLPELPQDQHTKVLPGWVLLKGGVSPAILLSTMK